ncbi:dynein beta chain, ciliary-like [Oratosquilla oratoria]|uniref:dynein beta chain, ciliary-like n=1 Tax=Oratosquilla oratoria TaxID=337810 RepID=UPI003F76E96C
MTDSQLRSALEAVVIKWVHQVDEVLRQDTDFLLISAFAMAASSSGMSSSVSVASSSGALPGPGGDLHHPKPLEEHEFWKKRRKNLEHIARQLQDKKVRMMCNILEVTESAYFPALAKMRSDVMSAVREARDVIVYLTPLKPLVEAVEAAEFPDVVALLPPLVHCVCILWASCPAYRKPDRIVILFKEITNLLIQQACVFIGTVAFQAETQEPLQKIDTCIRIFKEFRTIFNDYKSKIGNFFGEDQKVIPWEFHPTYAFRRMDQFLARLYNIKEFLKIEKIEFGGPKGKTLNVRMSAIYSEFNEAYTAFSIGTYDCLNPAELEFDHGHDVFRAKVTELEQRLSLIVSHALQESLTAESFFKVIELLGTIVDRAILKAELFSSMPIIFGLLKEELEVAKIVKS